MALKILLVDNHIMSLKATESLLQQFDSEVQGCIESREALRRLDREKFDALFIDDCVPAMQGFEMVRRARKSALNSRVVIVLLADQYDSRTRRAGFEAGVSVMVEKPMGRKQAAAILNLVAAAKGVEDTRFRKLDFRVPVTCRSSSARTLAQSLSVGEEGMVLRGGLEAAPGYKVELRFAVPFLAERLTVNARVAAKGPGQIVMQFEDLSEQQRAVIRRLLRGQEQWVSMAA